MMPSENMKQWVLVLNIESIYGNVNNCFVVLLFPNMWMKWVRWVGYFRKALFIFLSSYVYQDKYM
jgi:hypothetical protein